MNGVVVLSRKKMRFLSDMVGRIIIGGAVRSVGKKSSEVDDEDESGEEAEQDQHTHR